MGLLDGVLGEVENVAEVDQRHGFRGPIAHLSGAKLDKKRAELKAERRKPLGENEKVEGLVEKVETTCPPQ